MKLLGFSKLKKFSSYFIELIIVVLGVSIAFQLNVWNDTRKARTIEKQLLENFASENKYNLTENGTSGRQKRESIELGQRFVELLAAPDPDQDSIRYYLASFYEISLPNFTTTQLENYLNYTTGSSDLREEMLNLKSLCFSLDKLGDLYIEQKQEKYFDFLADAVEMNNNLEVVNKDKLVSVEFRNNLRLLIIYEESVASLLDEIKVSQETLALQLAENQY